MVVRAGGFGRRGVSTIPAMPKDEKLPPGITRRADGKLLARVWSKRDNKRIGKVFGRREVSAAKTWRRETLTAIDHGEIVAGESPTLRRATALFLAGAEDGTIRTRSRQRYKPATVARYRRALDGHLLDELGSFKLNEIRTGQLERLVGRLQAKGLAANSVRNAFMPLQAIYRWAVRQELVRVDPTSEIELPLDDGRKDRFAAPEEIVLRLATLPLKDRPLWATAFYAGLRYGELMALRWSDVDRASGIIHVQLSHDPQARITGAPKSTAGIRKVPIPAPLREYLIDHSMRANPHQPLVFSRWSLAGRKRGPDGPFNASGIYQRANRYWAPHGIGPMSLHDCRHTYASLMIAAGENPKALQTYLGHSSITTTYDRYGHLMPGAERESADRLSAYLDVEPHDENWHSIGTNDQPSTESVGRDA
jgi:integrase